MEANTRNTIKIFAREKIAPHEPRLQADSSSIPRKRIWSIGNGWHFDHARGANKRGSALETCKIPQKQGGCLHFRSVIACICTAD